LYIAYHLDNFDKTIKNKVMENYQVDSLNSTSQQIDFSKNILYTAKAHTTGGRDGGSSRTSDGRLDIKLSDPGTAGKGTNPEQLFASGWSSCFLSAMKITAGKMKVRFPADAAVDAEVDLCLTGENAFLQARLNISLPGLEPQTAQAIAHGAHQICPYSKATRSNIAVQINVL
jgi:lipoyl-dependent peroxiredoxin